MQKELLDGIRSRDNQAFKQMYDTFIRYVYSIVIRYNSDTSNHQDIIQEVFAIVFLKIDTYNEKKGEFKTWLRMITVNQCIQHYHRSKRQIQTTTLETISYSEQPIESSHEQMSREDLLKHLIDMPIGYKQVFMLVEIDGFSHKEAGRLLKISPETSRSQLHRAKRWLKENITVDQTNSFYNVL